MHQYANIHITAVIAMHFCATLIRVSLLEIYGVHQKLRDVITSFSQAGPKKQNLYRFRFVGIGLDRFCRFGFVWIGSDICGYVWIALDMFGYV